MNSVFTLITGYIDSKILPRTAAGEILFVVNFKNLDSFTFRVNLDKWTITVLDFQKDLVYTTGNQKDFNELMEVRKSLFMVINMCSVEPISRPNNLYECY